MARRVYGSASSATEASSEKVEEIVKPPVRVEKKAKKRANPKLVKFLIASVSVVLVIGIVVSVYYYARYILYDNGYGFDSPEGLTLSYLKVFENNMQVDEDAPYGDILMTYLPREARSVGYGADTVHMNEFRKFSVYNLRFESVQMVGNEPVDISDKIPMMETGFYSVYHKRLNIRDAKEMVVLVNMLYTIDEVEYVQEVELHIPCVKCVSGRWYLYTGAPYIEEEPIELEMIRAEDEMADAQPDIPEMQQRTSVDRPIPEVEPYDEAFEDLQAGYLGINGAACVMPMTYAEALQVGFEVDEEEVPEESRTVQPNYILRWLPVRFLSSEYDYMDCRMDLGNASDDVADISDCLVTTLYFGKPQNDTMDYFDICLPGNVTIGTSFDDVCEVYGRENLEQIRGTSNEALLSPPDESEPIVERVNYNTWNVTIGDETTSMTEEEYNEFSALHGVELAKQMEEYQDYLAFLDGSETSNIVLHSQRTSVYRVTMSEHNYIYLGFENSRLVSIEWYYFDLSSFN